MFLIIDVVGLGVCVLVLMGCFLVVFVMIFVILFVFMDFLVMGDVCMVLVLVVGEFLWGFLEYVIMFLVKLVFGDFLFVNREFVIDWDLKGDEDLFIFFCIKV